MNCKHCGAYIGSNATVCPECGQKTEATFDGKTCLHCGYKGDLEPAKMVRWYEWYIIFVTFPFGFLYLMYIYSKRQNPNYRGYKCPVCKKISKFSNERADKEQVKTIAKNVATNKQIRKSFTDLKESVKDLHDTF